MQMSTTNPPQYMEYNRNANTSENILFVADLPEEISEEDLNNFFKAYKFTLAKIIQYYILFILKQHRKNSRICSFRKPRRW